MNDDAIDIFGFITLMMTILFLLITSIDYFFDLGLGNALLAGIFGER